MVVPKPRICRVNQLYRYVIRGIPRWTQKLQSDSDVWVNMNAEGKEAYLFAESKENTGKDSRQHDSRSKWVNLV